MSDKIHDHVSPEMSSLKVFEEKVSLISMVPLDVDPINDVNVDAREHLTRLMEEAGWNVASDAIQATFNDLANEGVLADFTDAAAKDLLYDVSSILEDSTVTELGSDYSLRAYRRNKLIVKNASVIDLDSGEVFSHPPIETNSAQLNLVDGEDRTSVLTVYFNHRFALWLFVSWLGVADKLWSGRIKRHRLPAWMEEPLVIQMRTSLSGRAALAVKDSIGKGILNVDLPYTLRLQGDSISLAGLRSIVLSADSQAPTNKKLLLTLLDLRITGDEEAADAQAAVDLRNSIVDGNNDIGEGSDRHSSISKQENTIKQKRKSSTGYNFPVARAIGSTVKGVAKGIGTVVTTTASTVVHTTKDTANLAAYTAVGAVNVAANTAVGAAKTLASGDPLKIIKTAGETVVDVGTTLASTITAAPNVVFGKNQAYLLIRGSSADKGVLYPGDGVSGGQLCLDVDSENYSNIFLQDKEKDMENSKPTKASSSLALVRRAPGVTSYPPKHVSELALEFSVLQSGSFERKPVVQGIKRIGTLLANARLWHRTEADFRTTVVLVHNVEFVVNLVEAKGLVIPSDHRAVSLFAKARLVDSQGHSNTTDFVEDFTFQSPTVTVSPNPSFNNHKFVIRCSDHYDRQEFVRVELFLDYVAARASLGAIFIPLSYFDVQQETYTFPVTKHTRSQHGIIPLSSSFANNSNNNNSSTSSSLPSINAADLVNISLSSVRDQLANLGSVTVRLARKERPEKYRNAVLDVAGSVRSAGLLDDTYLAEALPASACNSSLEGIVIETVSVAALPDGLQLLEMDQEVAMSASAARDSMYSSISGRNNSLPSISDKNNNLLSESSTKKNQEVIVEIEVFENQRRSPYPPFDWSSSAITRPRFSNLDYSIGYAFDKIEDARPPEGFTWSGDWAIDMEPLGPMTAGREGWMYSFTFGKLLDNYKKRKAFTDPFNTHARRRRLVRRAVCTSPDNTAELTSRDALMSFQVANNPKHVKQTAGLGSGLLIGAAANLLTGAGQLGNSLHGDASKDASQHGRDLLEDWRKRKAEAGLLLGSCEEKETESSAIAIAWDQVHFAEVISASVLLIGVRIHRCLGNTNRGFTFRPSDIHLFVSNCPAHDLKSLIDERKWLVKTRQNLRRLIASGDVFGGETNMRNSAKGESVGEDLDCDAVPETEELSLASEIAADLDSQIAQIQTSIRKLERQRVQIDASINQLQQDNVVQPALDIPISTDHSIDLQLHSLVLRSESMRKEILILKRRLCRLRLYLAALYGVGLTGIHSFDDESVRAIVTRDLQRVHNILMDDAVATANNRIEFLLDVAEKRIRDVALCGWKQPSKLQRCAELFANCYLTEIIRVLGAFFEDRSLMEIKGLGGKIELIRTYMRHNDRLDHILESAFRPYRLHAHPPALLSLRLDFDQLIDWYASSLNSEMRMRVDSVFQIWRSQSRADSNVAGHFCKEQNLLPWYPSMSEGQRKFFFSGMPSELQAVLVQYLAVARIRKDQVAMSYRDALGRLDSKVCLAYANSFLYLAETYQHEVSLMKKTPWYYISLSSLTREGEAEERLTWLASVTNDMYRSIQRRVFEVNQILQGDEEGNAMLNDPELQSLSLRCLSGLYKAQEDALVHTATILLSLFLIDTDWNGDSFFMRIQDELLQSALKETHNSSVFSSMIQNYKKLVFIEFEQFFEEEVAQYLWCNCVLQICTLFFHVLHHSWRTLALQSASSLMKLRMVLSTEARDLSSSIQQQNERNQFDIPPLMLQQPECFRYQLCPILRKTKLCEEVGVLLSHIADVLADDIKVHLDHVDAHLLKLRDVVTTSFTEIDTRSIAVLLEQILGMQGLQQYQPKMAPASNASTPSPRPLSMTSQGGTPKSETPVKTPTKSPINNNAPIPEKRRSIFGNISETLRTIHMPTKFASDSTHHHTPPPPLSVQSLDDDEDGDDEEIMNKKLQAQKELTIAACMDTHLIALRADAKTTTASLFVDNPHLQDPISRACDKYSFADLMLGDDQIGIVINKIVSTSSSHKGSSSGATLSKFFGGFKNTSTAIHKARSLHHIHHAHMTSKAEMVIVLSKLQVSNLFFIGGNFSLGLTQATPKPYVRVTVSGGGRTLADIHSDILNADGISRGCGSVNMSLMEAKWAEDLQIAVTDTSVSQVDVTLRVCYAVSSYEDDHILGSVHFSFSPFDYPSSFVERSFALDTTEVSSNVVRSAVKQVLIENRSLPTISFLYKCQKQSS